MFEFCFPNFLSKQGFSIDLSQEIMKKIQWSFRMLSIGTFPEKSCAFLKVLPFLSERPLKIDLPTSTRPVPSSSSNRVNRFWRANDKSVEIIPRLPRTLSRTSSSIIENLARWRLLEFNHRDRNVHIGKCVSTWSMQLLVEWESQFLSLISDMVYAMPLNLF